MTQHIIVGVDDSETAARAAEVAASLAARIGATLHVITACDEEESVEVGVGSDRVVLNRSDEAAEIARSVAAAVAPDGVAVESGARVGRPADVLCDEAQRFPEALIVVGNKRVQGPSRLLGSVASAVLHQAPCDVYVVKTT